jgi:hypothetical protein
MKNNLSNESPKWSRLFYVPVLWLLSGTAVGAFLSWHMGMGFDGYGFIGVFLGACVGLAGTIAHCVLFLIPRFRRTPEPLQVLLLSACTLAELQLLESSWQSFATLSVPVLIAAVVFNRIIRLATRY